MTRGMNTLFFMFACLGAADYLLGNRFGLADEFERGLNCFGNILIAMAGFMSLSSVMGRVLAPIAAPVFAIVGADPSAIAGILLATDAGGAILAEELAVNPDAGAFHGYFVASMLGASMMCIIPMTMISTDDGLRPCAIYGLVAGLFSVPVGCIAGGLLAGFDLAMILQNLIPAAILCALLFIFMIFFSNLIVRSLQILGKILLCVSLTGLMISAAGKLLGVTLAEDLIPLDEIFAIAGTIVLTLCGIFPLAAVILRVFKRAVAGMAGMLKIDETDAVGMLTTLVNPFPALGRMREMTPRGLMLNTAVLVVAHCMLGDYFAYISTLRPDLLWPVITAKAISTFIAISITLLIQRTHLWNKIWPNNVEV